MSDSLKSSTSPLRLSSTVSTLCEQETRGNRLQGEGASRVSRRELKLSGVLPGQLHPFGRLSAAAMRRLTGATDAWIPLPGKRAAQMAIGEESDARAQVRLPARGRPRQKTNVLSGSMLG